MACLVVVKPTLVVLCISNDSEVDVDVKIRITKAASAFGCLKKSILATLPYSIQL